MLHWLIWKEDLRDEFDGWQQEEEFVHNMEDNIFPHIIAAIKMLNQHPLRAIDIQTLHQHLKVLRGKMQFACAGPPPLNAELCDALLEALGLKDTTGNGIPDFFDDLISPLLDCLGEWLENNDWPMCDWHPQQLCDMFPHICDWATPPIQSEPDPTVQPGVPCEHDPTKIIPCP